MRELDRLAEDIELLDREIAERVIEDPSVKRLLTVTGVNVIVAAGLVAAIGDIRRFSSPQKLVSYVGLNGLWRLRTARRSVSLLTGSISLCAKLAAGRPPRASPR